MSSILSQSDTEYWLERAVVADGHYMSDTLVGERRDVGIKTLKAMYDAIAWWKANPTEGNEIIAKGMGMSIADVELVLGKDGTSLDGGLYVYDFMEAAQFCGAAPGEPAVQPDRTAKWPITGTWSANGGSSSALSKR